MKIRFVLWDKKQEYIVEEETSADLPFSANVDFTRDFVVNGKPVTGKFDWIFVSDAQVVLDYIQVR